MLHHSSMAPGPGNYNPVDSIIWNSISTDDKGKNQNKKANEDKKEKNDKKRTVVQTPGPFSYDTLKLTTMFPEVERRDKLKDKKDRDEKVKKKEDVSTMLFGKKLNNKDPGPGT